MCFKIFQGKKKKKKKKKKQKGDKATGSEILTELKLWGSLLFLCICLNTFIIKKMNFKNLNLKKYYNIIYCFKELFPLL